MSRKPEQRLWDRFRAAIGNQFYAERIENVVGVGRPDVDTLFRGSFCPVELKQVADWPKRATTRVLGDDGLSQDQKNWHLNWRNHGGRSIIVVGVGLDVYAFFGLEADYVNDYNKAQFQAAAIAHGFPEIIRFIKGE